MFYLSLHKQADGKHACSRPGNSPSSLCPSPQFRLPRSSWALLLLQSPTASNSLPSAPSKEVLINALHFTASQGSNCQQDYDKLFSCCFKTIWRTVCPPGAEPPSPAAAGQRGGSKVPPSPRGLFGYDPTKALRTSARSRPGGDLCSVGDLCQGSFSVSRQAPWHRQDLGSPSTRPASWAIEVETQEVCQPRGVISFLRPRSYSACMAFFFLN